MFLHQNYLRTVSLSKPKKGLKIFQFFSLVYRVCGAVTGGNFKLIGEY
jgi:hypothetical protein